MRTVRSDSAAVSSDPWLSLRVSVRCGMPSFRDRTPLPRWSLSASAETEPAGRPVRTSCARSSGFLMALPSTFRPPRISAIASVSILALWLLMIRHLADVCKVGRLLTREEHLLICQPCRDRLKATDEYLAAMRPAAGKV